MDTCLVFTVAGCSCKSSLWRLKHEGLAHSQFKGSSVMLPAFGLVLFFFLFFFSPLLPCGSAQFHLMETSRPGKLGRSQHHTEMYSLLSLFWAGLAFGLTRPPALLTPHTPAGRWLRSFVVIRELISLGVGAIFLNSKLKEYLYLAVWGKTALKIRQNLWLNHDREQFYWGMFFRAVLSYSQSLLCTEWK